jgi:hypothetical protein
MLMLVAAQWSRAAGFMIDAAQRSLRRVVQRNIERAL